MSEVEAEMVAAVDEDGGAMRGLTLGVMLVIPIWLVIAAALAAAFLV